MFQFVSKAFLAVHTKAPSLHLYFRPNFMQLLQRRLWLDVLSALIKSWSSFGCVVMEDTFIVMIGLGLRDGECGRQLVTTLCVLSGVYAPMAVSSINYMSSTYVFLSTEDMSMRMCVPCLGFRSTRPGPYFSLVYACMQELVACGCENTNTCRTTKFTRPKGGNGRSVHKACPSHGSFWYFLCTPW